MNIRLYNAAVAVLRTILGLFLPLKAEGVENIPAEGGFILCANHITALDPVHLAVSIPNRHIHYMAKAEVFKNKYLAKLFYAIGTFPVDRGHSDLNAVRTALKIVGEGHALGIFPQGTRARNNERLPMLSGVSLIAMRANAPVIPCYLDGPFRIFRRTRIIFGQPVDISRFGRKFDSATLAEVTQAIENAVWSLKPAE